METRSFARMGRDVSVVGLGTWQFGADWGPVDEADALTTLAAAGEAGVTFVDTADAFGDGRSERLVGQFLRARPDLPMTVATKIGARAGGDPAAYTLENFRAWIDRSRANLGLDVLDLVQLHCPPPEVYAMEAVFEALETLVDEKRITAYGVSVRSSAEALAAIARPGVTSVQIVLNLLRHKPLEEVLTAAREAGVGVIARGPLASGLLAGGYDEHTSFPPDDHRAYNRHGEVFDVGDTFSGVDFATGLAAVRRLAPLVPDGAAMAQFALRWIIDQPGVTTVVAGARNPAQARANASAARLRPLSIEALTTVTDVYNELIRPHVHHRW
ncbi:MAG TPA: aldo/keto reductase [Pilimelia sp.]|nr:aldo/keto reductase [Pilimelia sp.]